MRWREVFQQHCVTHERRRGRGKGEVRRGEFSSEKPVKKKKRELKVVAAEFITKSSVAGNRPIFFFSVLLSLLCRTSHACACIVNLSFGAAHPRYSFSFCWCCSLVSWLWNSVAFPRPPPPHTRTESRRNAREWCVCKVAVRRLLGSSLKEGGGEGVNSVEKHKEHKKQYLCCLFLNVSIAPSQANLMCT
jgi:hypothetical protein